MSNYYENDFAAYRIADGILYFLYKREVILNLDAAQKIVSDRLMVQNERAYPIFCDARWIKSADKEARDYLAKEGSIMAKAVAILVMPPVTEAIINFYMISSKPVIPTAIFTEKSKAVEFLDAYK